MTVDQLMRYMHRHRLYATTHHEDLHDLQVRKLGKGAVAPATAVKIQGAVSPSAPATSAKIQGAVSSGQTIKTRPSAAKPTQSTAVLPKHDDDDDDDEDDEDDDEDDAADVKAVAPAATKLRASIRQLVAQIKSVKVTAQVGFYPYVLFLSEGP